MGPPGLYKDPVVEATGAVTQALFVAWQLTAPKTLVRAHRDAE